MSEAVNSRYEIKARQLAFEQRQSEQRLKGASEIFKAASERVADRNTSFENAKARATRSKGGSLLELDRMQSNEKVLRAAKRRLEQSLKEFDSASEVRNGVLKELSAIKSKGDFLAEKIQNAEFRKLSKIEENSNEAIVELAALKPADKATKLESEIAAPSSSDEIESVEIGDAVQQAPQLPDLIPSVQIADAPASVVIDSSAANSDSAFKRQNAPQQSDEIQVWEDKGVVTAKFDVGESFKVELTAEGMGPVAVYIAPQNGKEVSAATVVRIKEQLRAKNIEFSSIVVAKGGK